jgi:hypothetical protein
MPKKKHTIYPMKVEVFKVDDPGILINFQADDSDDAESTEVMLSDKTAEGLARALMDYFAGRGQPLH